MHRLFCMKIAVAKARLFEDSWKIPTFLVIAVGLFLLSIPSLGDI